MYFGRYIFLVVYRCLINYFQMDAEVKCINIFSLLTAASLHADRLSGVGNIIEPIASGGMVDDYVYYPDPPEASNQCYIPLLSAIKRGYKSHERIGDSINILEVRYRIEYTVADGTTNNEVIQVSLVKLKSRNGNEVIDLSDIYSGNGKFGYYCNTIKRNINERDVDIICSHPLKTTKTKVGSTDETAQRYGMNLHTVYRKDNDNKVMTNDLVLLFASSKENIDEYDVTVAVRASVY